MKKHPLDRDMELGFNLGKPLFKLLIEGLIALLEQNNINPNQFELFNKLLQSDSETLQLFTQIQKESFASEGTLKYAVRIALLLLDSFVGHQVIFILTGIDIRAIKVVAAIVTPLLSKSLLIKFLGDNTIHRVLFDEISLIQTCIKILKD